MAHTSLPVTNADYTEATFGVVGHSMSEGCVWQFGDPSPFPLTLSAVNDDCTVGAGVAIFAQHIYTITGTETLTMAAPVSGTRTYTVALRYDPAAGSGVDNISLVTYFSAPSTTGGLRYMPLRTVARPAGQALNQSVQGDVRPYVQPTFRVLTAAALPDVTGNLAKPLVLSRALVGTTPIFHEWLLNTVGWINLDDPDWADVDLAGASGALTSVFGRLQYRFRRGLTELRGGVQRSNGNYLVSDAGYTTLGYIPTEYGPTKNIRTMVAFSIDTPGGGGTSTQAASVILEVLPSSGGHCEIRSQAQLGQAAYVICDGISFPAAGS